MNHTRLISVQVATAILAIARITSGQGAATTAPAEQALLSQIEAMKPPVFDQSRRNDEQYRESFEQTARRWQQRREDLISDLFTRFPQHSRAMELMCDRWRQIILHGPREPVIQVIDETSALLAKTSDPNRRADVLFMRAMAQVRIRLPFEPTPFLDEFLAAAPHDERGGELLVMLGLNEHNPQQKVATLRRAVENYGSTTYGQMAKGMLRRAEGVGKPFDLDFTDAISGKAISVQKDLKGKIVVIDFWATWCAPCVAEMPQLKQTYEKYKDRGVEFIGVSLDAPEADGGLIALKQCVADNRIPWPQYYQGDAWNGKLSSSWGITGIPAAFVVDRQGKLVSVEARGDIEGLISRLLSGGHEGHDRIAVEHE